MSILKENNSAEIFNNVLVTEDYSIFKFMEGNRNINISHLKRIRASFEEKQLPIPIVVTKNMEIFEGQHRYMACRELGLPIYYIIIDGLTLRDAITINTVTKKWSSDNYFEHYLALGYPEYIKLQQFIDDTGLTLNNARTFLDNSAAQKGKGKQSEFCNGQFSIEDYARSLNFFYTHMDYKECPSFSRVACKLAILKILNHPDYDHSRMILKLEQLAYRVTNRASTTDYLLLFSEIYNYNASKDKKVYFHLD